MEANIAINQTYPDQQRDDLPLPWILTLEIFNRNMKTIFQLKKTRNQIFCDSKRRREIRHRYKKEQ